jgi:transcription elongation factor GreB
VFFGATVTIADIDDVHRTVTLVGDDEAEAGEGRIGWSSPMAKALRGAKVGDVKTVMLPTGPKEWEVMEIGYPN